MSSKYRKLSALFIELEVGMILMSILEVAEKHSPDKFWLSAIADIDKRSKHIALSFKHRPLASPDRRHITQFLDLYRIIKDNDEKILLDISRL